MVNIHCHKNKTTDAKETKHVNLLAHIRNMPALFQWNLFSVLEEMSVNYFLFKNKFGLATHQTVDKNKLEMCQYDTDALAQGILTRKQAFCKKKAVEKGHNSHNNWRILP